jgi:hypothetical protein
MTTPLQKYLTENNLNLLKEYTGHIAIGGRYHNQDRNKYYLVSDKNIKDTKNNEYYIMDCFKNNSDNVYFKFSKKSLPNIKNILDIQEPTWFLAANGYIQTHIKINN